MEAAAVGPHVHRGVLLLTEAGVEEQADPATGRHGLDGRVAERARHAVDGDVGGHGVARRGW